MTAATVGYAGMGHLGLTSSGAAAEMGFEVVCFDADPHIISLLQSSKSPIAEPGLQDLLSRNSSRLRFTTAIDDLRSCDVVFVVADVTTDNEDNSDLSAVRTLIASVGNVLKSNGCLVIQSQVPPGFCRALGSNHQNTFYQVETLIVGRALEQAMRPERIIVGSADAAVPLPKSYLQFLDCYQCPIILMSYESAELTKLAINLFLASSITTTNMLAEICEKIGADWQDIASALRLDRRIGKYAYLTAGLGLGGGNIERDLASIIAVGEPFGLDASLVHAWRTNSHHRRDWVLQLLKSAALSPSHGPLALLGLAYKENTCSTKNSPAIKLLSTLSSFEINVFDPVVTPREHWHPRLRRAENALEACNGASALIVMTPWPEFKKLSVSDIASRLKGNLVLDPFGCLDHNACLRANLTHHRLGTSLHS